MNCRWTVKISANGVLEACGIPAREGSNYCAFHWLWRHSGHTHGGRAPQVTDEGEFRYDEDDC